MLKQLRFIKTPILSQIQHLSIMKQLDMCLSYKVLRLLAVRQEVRNLNRRIQNYYFFKFLISQVEVYVVFFLDKEPVNSQAFSITVGTNFELYLIVSIGFIFGFLLIITIVVMMRRRKHNSRSSEYHGEVNITNSEDQNDETLIWTNVNLNSSTRNYNTFSQIFGAGKIKVLF